MPLKDAVEVNPIDARGIGGSCNVALVALQEREHVRTIKRLQRAPPSFRVGNCKIDAFRALRSLKVHTFIGLELLLEGQTPLQVIAQFPDISRPRGATEPLDERWLEQSRSPSLISRERIEQPGDDERDVFWTLPQRWQSDAKHCQSKIEIGAKSTFVDFTPEIAVRRRNDSYVNWDLRVGPHLADFT
ncbi:MAG TPA: hypothetical protein VEI47_10620 [Gemmatimonadales bacterium]|nr:hypothetical protein [Gemmatimonadales bacterium]